MRTPRTAAAVLEAVWSRRRLLLMYMTMLNTLGTLTLSLPGVSQTTPYRQFGHGGGVGADAHGHAQHASWCLV
jgi:hypothetical protein